MFNYSAQSEEEVLAKAQTILESRMRKLPFMQSEACIKQYLTLNAAGKEHEELHALFLNDAFEMIAFEKLAIGTHNCVSTSARDLAIAALRAGATAIVLTHNHPVGSSEPSQQDLDFTVTMGAALSLVDVKLLDHMVVCNTSVTSIKEYLNEREAKPPKTLLQRMQEHGLDLDII